MQFAENHAYKKSDVVVSLLPHTKDYMIEHGMKPDHLVHTQRSCDKWSGMHIGKELPDEHEAFRDWRLKGRIVIGYFEAMSFLMDYNC